MSEITDLLADEAVDTDKASKMRSHTQEWKSIAEEVRAERRRSRI